MPFSYEPRELQQFLDGAAEVVPGPLGGILIHRVPQRYLTPIVEACEWFRRVELCPSGVHLNLRISAPTTLTIAAYQLVPGEHLLSILTHTPEGVRVRDVSVPTPGDVVVDPADDSYTLESGTPMRVQLTPEDSEQGVFTLLPPHTCIVELLGLESELPIERVEPSPEAVRWVHYGSSISHGAQVASPARRWTEQVRRALDVHLREYSLSGNAQMDPCMAHCIADTEADIITCAIGINITNADSMRERFFIPALHGFLDTIREKHPYTPLYVSTACSCPIQENAPGPSFMRPDGMFAVPKREVEYDVGALTLQRTRELIEQVTARRDDPALTVVDGRTFFGPDDAHLLVDNLHPGPEGIDLIAQRVTKALAAVLPEPQPFPRQRTPLARRLC